MVLFLHVLQISKLKSDWKKLNIESVNKSNVHVNEIEQLKNSFEKDKQRQMQLYAKEIEQMKNNIKKERQHDQAQPFLLGPAQPK